MPLEITDSVKALLGMGSQDTVNKDLYRRVTDTKPGSIEASRVDLNNPQAKPSQDRSGIIPFDKLINIESGGKQFDPKTGETLTSKKGAMGIAQMLHSTAKETAQKAGIDWDEKRFKNDKAYNYKLGETYYYELIDKFGGDSYKAAAAYNAGPGAVGKLLTEHKDKWADNLPLETKNYIKFLGYNNQMKVADTTSDPKIREKYKLPPESYPIPNKSSKEELQKYADEAGNKGLSIKKYDDSYYAVPIEDGPVEEQYILENIAGLRVPKGVKRFKK